MKKRETVYRTGVLAQNEGEWDSVKNRRPRLI
jgi:hypothetical protein